MERSALGFHTKPHSEPQISLAGAGVAEDKGRAGTGAGAGPRAEIEVGRVRGGDKNGRGRG